LTETYIVTGGAGFIGSHIAERLLRDGHRVRIIDNFATGKHVNLAHLTGDLQVHDVSITDRETLAPLFEGVDYVFHQAALASVPRSVADPLSTHEANATGTLNVLIAARDAGVKRVIYAASSSAYGDVDVDAQDETLSPHPLSPYGVSKLAGEYYCQSFTQVYGLETVALRYFNVFGPRQDETSQYSAVIPRFISTMMDGKPPTIYGDGKQSRDFTYVDNVVHGNLLALNAPEASGEVMNLAVGGSVTLLELVEKINRQLGTSFEPIHAPERTGDIKYSRADVTKAIELLDFAPIADFDEGLARTVEWFKQRGTAR
jgi:UDP-glucose 4-epimerase